MNLALCGICVWKNDDDGLYHLGHREVIKAKYESTKTGQKIISHVQLGEVLFDAGEIVPDLGFDFDAIKARLDAIEDALQHDDVVIPTNVSAFVNDVPYLTETKAARDFQPKGNYVKRVNDQYPNADGEVTISIGVQSVTINGSTKYPDSSGNVSFNVSTGSGSSLFDVKIENNHLYKTTNGTNWTDLGQVNGGGGGTSDVDLTDLKLKVGNPSIPAERNHLFISYDNGATWTDVGEFIDTTGTSELAGYVTWVDLQNLYYTKTQCDNLFVKKSEITGELEYYRTFTIYKRTDSPTNVPSTPLANVTAV